MKKEGKIERGYGDWVILTKIVCFVCPKYLEAASCILKYSKIF